MLYPCPHNEILGVQIEKNGKSEKLRKSVRSDSDDHFPLPAGLSFKQNCLLHPNKQFSMIVHIIVDQNQLLFKSSFVDYST